MNYFKNISNLNVPNYKYISKNKTFGGYEIIKGKDLTPKSYAKLTAIKKQKLILDLAKFLTIFHIIPHQKVGSLGFEEYKLWKELIEYRRKEYKTKIKPKLFPKLKPAKQKFIEKFSIEFFNANYSYQKELGHYDLGHDHILMNSSGDISGIIDFGDLSFSDPALEFNGFLIMTTSFRADCINFIKDQKIKIFLLGQKNIT